MSAPFHRPGCSCHATKIASHVAQVGATTWPLSTEDSAKIHAACPSWDEEFPAFYQGMGFKGPG